MGGVIIHEDWAFASRSWWGRSSVAFSNHSVSLTHSLTHSVSKLKFQSVPMKEFMKESAHYSSIKCFFRDVSISIIFSEMADVETKKEKQTPSAPAITIIAKLTT